MAFTDFYFNDTTIENVTEQKILVIKIDSKLDFKSHLKNISKKNNQKLNVLAKT